MYLAAMLPPALRDVAWRGGAAAQFWFGIPFALFDDESRGRVLDQTTEFRLALCRFAHFIRSSMKIDESDENSDRTSCKAAYGQKHLRMTGIQY